ncbi:hypothetical protein [Nitrososphaera sp. AFS]|uniref:hypothetical protein n=1 Tax=Nitrososphaera sp. AFS TaxID=2301191 RepID=UPI0013922B65|nr:hypothetical protein [Nitrososphaera sp. AFS]NAL77282.1 hypothetical protein [Nitrososphaera sp. AFS]
MPKVPVDIELPRSTYDKFMTYCKENRLDSALMMMEIDKRKGLEESDRSQTKHDLVKWLNFKEIID